MFKNSSWLWFWIGKLCVITWIILLHRILYCIFLMPGHQKYLWCPGIRNSKNAKIYLNLSKLECFLFLQKSGQSEASIGEFFSEYAKKKKKNQDALRKIVRITRSLNIPLKVHVYELFVNLADLSATFVRGAKTFCHSIQSKEQQTKIYKPISCSYKWRWTSFIMLKTKNVQIQVE